MKLGMKLGHGNFLATRIDLHWIITRETWDIATVPRQSA